MKKLLYNPFVWAVVALVLMVLLVAVMPGVKSKLIAGTAVGVLSLFISRLEVYNRKDYPNLSRLSFPVAVVTCLLIIGSVVFYVWISTRLYTGGQL
ncbi:hypothetical protein HON36_01065 [Candidatus Parcubacteria bacterium]|jgi:heme exporter protein D|nr:hypothetical protein [Candidatus Parcubacteria bacterium]MBT7228395.1 hypothetical protein [Candidatus Parcubacteria bacterium]